MSPEQLRVALEKYKKRREHMQRREANRRQPRTEAEIDEARKRGVERAAKSESSNVRIRRVAMLIHQHVKDGLDLPLDDIYEGLAKNGLRWEQPGGRVSVEPVSISEIAEGIDLALGYMSFVSTESGYREAVRADTTVEEQRDKRYKSPSYGQRFIVRRAGPESEKSGIITSAIVIVDNRGNLKIEEMKSREIPPYKEPDVSKMRRRTLSRPGGEKL